MGYKETGQQILYKIFDPLIKGLKAIGITPNHITLIGFILNIAAALHLISYGSLGEVTYGDNLFGFGMILGFAGLMDTMDGRLARLFDMKSDFGAFFDSVIDRYSEFVMFLGLTIYFFLFNSMMGVLAMLIACMGSIMVSYTRSRSETLGVDCSVGLMQRPERILFVGLWAILWGILIQTNQGILDEHNHILGMDYMVLGFMIFAVATNITAVRRLLHSQKEFAKINN